MFVPVQEIFHGIFTGKSALQNGKKIFDRVSMHLADVYSGGQTATGRNGGNPEGRWQIGDINTLQAE